MNTKGSKYAPRSKPRRKRTAFSRIRSFWSRNRISTAVALVALEASVVGVSLLAGFNALWSPLICAVVLGAALSLPPMTAMAVAAVGGAAWSAADLSANIGMATVFGSMLRLAFLIALAKSFATFRNSIASERKLSETDYLTGVMNKRGFFRHATEILNSKKKRLRPISIALIDLDNFKKVNDTMGHAAGDKALRMATQSIRRHLRHTDALARIGGDEFLVLLPNVGRTEALVLAERIRHRLNHDLRDGGLFVTGSVGLVTFEIPPKSVRHLMERADWLMFQAKASGKNAVRSDVVQSGKPTLM